MKLLFAFLCSASAFPSMLIFKNSKGESERLPNLLQQGEWLYDTDKSWYHNAKDYTSETFRKDCEWWSKFTLFVICVLGVAAVF